MNSFNFISRLTALCAGAFLFLSLSPARAQMPTGKNATGMNTALLIKLFSGNTNFVAKADARVQDKTHPENATTMPMGFEMLGDKIRMEINLALVKSREMSPEFASQMKAIGMDQMVSILTPENKTVITIYPGLKAYAQSPMDKDEADGFKKDYKITKTHIGHETIDGRACDKNDLALTDEKGAVQHATVWNAPDLKNFPVQIQLTEEDSTLTMKFHDVKLGRPEDAHFAPPAGLTKYDSVDALLSEAIVKKANAANVK